MPGATCGGLSGGRSCAVRSSTASDRSASYWPGMPHEAKNAADRCSGDDRMKIIVVNVNTSKPMTDVIAEAAGRYVSPGTAVVALRPYFGAEAVDCNFESYLSAVAVMDRVLAYDEPYDAVILAGSGDRRPPAFGWPVGPVCLGAGERNEHARGGCGSGARCPGDRRRGTPRGGGRPRRGHLPWLCGYGRAGGGDYN